MTFFAGCRFDLAFYQRVQRHISNPAWARPGSDRECFFVRREKLHVSDFLGVHLAFEINDLISPQDAIVVTSRPAFLVMRGKFCEYLAFSYPRPQWLNNPGQPR